MNANVNTQTNIAPNPLLRIFPAAAGEKIIKRNKVRKIVPILESKPEKCGVCLGEGCYYKAIVGCRINYATMELFLNAVQTGIHKDCQAYFS